MTQKILFVDDEQSLLNGIERRLGFDYQLTTAASGELGLAAIKELGPFAVIVTDMRMPKMNGIEFVNQARPLAPDSVYMMLTGNQDQATATQAVNEGQVFRFLNKPCDHEHLTLAIDAALRQYQLLTGEKELLRKTFCGAVGVLTDVLEGTNPEFYSGAAQIEDIMNHLRTALRVEDSWEYHLASKLCLIGFALMPEPDRDDFLRTEPRKSHWLELLQTASEVSDRLIKRIPRLERIAAIIGNVSQVDGAWPKSAGTSEGIEQIGSTMLRLAIQIDRLAGWGVEAEEGVSVIRQSLPAVGENLEAAIEQSWPDTSAKPTTEVGLNGLSPDMVLAEDVLSIDGALLVRKGRRLTPTIIEKLACHEDRNVRQSKLVVYEQSYLSANRELALV